MAATPTTRAERYQRLINRNGERTRSGRTRPTPLDGRLLGLHPATGILADRNRPTGQTRLFIRNGLGVWGFAPSTALSPRPHMAGVHRPAPARQAQGHRTATDQPPHRSRTTHPGNTPRTSQRKAPQRKRSRPSSKITIGDTGSERGHQHQHQHPTVLTLNRAQLDPILATREASSPNRNHPPTATNPPTSTTHSHTQPPTHLLLTRPALPTPNPNPDHISEA